MDFDANAAVPSIALEGVLEGIATAWTPAQDLLESGESDPVFVVEVEADGAARAALRRRRQRPQSRNRNALHRAAIASAMATPATSAPRACIYFAARRAHPSPAAIRSACHRRHRSRNQRPNPPPRPAGLPHPGARGHHGRLRRDDRAQSSGRSRRRVARWTGSWYTVFDAVEPFGGGTITPALAKTLKRGLERYRLAGQDLRTRFARNTSRWKSRSTFASIPTIS